jgi:outer membrane protein TolC
MAMPVKSWIREVARLGATVAVAASLSGSGRPLFASEQTPPQASSPPQPAPVPQAPLERVQRLSVDDAVTLALENNLGIRAERLTPQIADMSVASAASAWTPALVSRFLSTSSTSPPDTFLSGTTDEIAEFDRVFSNLGIQQNIPRFGGSYLVTLDGARQKNNNIFDDFNPRVDSSLNIQVIQPLLRNFTIDGFRQQFLQAQKLREISDLTLRQTMTITDRNVRNAYWDLVAAIAQLAVQQQSLDLALEQLKNNRTRVEVGTMAPIDIVEAQAEVASNEEAVIVAEAAIRSAEDRLRTLVFNPEQPDFWSIRIEPSQSAQLEPRAIDIDAAVRNALDNRTDLVTARKQVEQTDIDLKYFRNQRLPDMNVQFNYGLTGLGGTAFEPLPGFPTPGETIVRRIAAERSFFSTLSDVFGNDFPRWTLQVNVGYPIGRSTAEANLARTRLQRQQSQTTVRELEIQAAAGIRDVGRSVTTNLKRVEATRKARELSEQRLQAEQKKFAVGMSSTFQVFQAQRDLARQRNQELRAIIDYNKALVDFDAIQKAPLGGR